jgi:predicted nucleic acid-binding protein
MIVLDTSGVVALLDPREKGHRHVLEKVTADAGPYILPALTLGEITHLISVRKGRSKLEEFASDLAEGAYVVDCSEEDLPRISELLGRHADLPLSFTDAAIVACAERTQAAVLTLDGDFDIVGREGTITVLS